MTSAYTLVNELADDGVFEPHPELKAAQAKSVKTGPNTVRLIDSSTSPG